MKNLFLCLISCGMTLLPSCGSTKSNKDADQVPVVPTGTGADLSDATRIRHNWSKMSPKEVIATKYDSAVLTCSFDLKGTFYSKDVAGDIHILSFSPSDKIKWDLIKDFDKYPVGHAWEFTQAAKDPEGHYIEHKGRVTLDKVEIQNAQVLVQKSGSPSESERYDLTHAPMIQMSAKWEGEAHYLTKKAATSAEKDEAFIDTLLFPSEISVYEVRPQEGSIGTKMSSAIDEKHMEYKRTYKCVLDAKLKPQFASDTKKVSDN